MLQSCLRVSITAANSMHWITQLLCYLYDVHSKDAISENDFESYIEKIIKDKFVRDYLNIENKKDKEGKTLYYLLYDIKNLVAITQENPSILEKYPALKTYLDSSGNLDTSILFTTNITSKDNAGLNADNTGLEFATYMLDFGTDEILEKISSGNLTEKHILNLILNIYNIMHQNVLKIRDFAKTDKKGYFKTNHNYDLKNDSDKIYNYFLKNS